MNIDHIEAFIYVVHFKNIHKAADALFLSQPTVTARIKSLERELDTELFERKGKRIFLTEKGRDFLPFAEQIIRTLQQGKTQLKKNINKNDVTIGANVITSQYFIPFALPLWKKENPHLRFKVFSAPNEILQEKLLQRKVDIAFIQNVEHTSLQRYEAFDNSIRLVVYPGHPFHIQKKPSIEQLAVESLVFFECGAFDWNRVKKIFEVSELEPKVEYQVNNLEVAKSLIISGNSIGFLPYLCIEKELKDGTLIEVDISHLVDIKQEIYLALINNNEFNPILLNNIRQTIEDYKKIYK